jgi:hypothetical protein
MLHPRTQRSVITNLITNPAAGVVLRGVAKLVLVFLCCLTATGASPARQPVIPASHFSLLSASVSSSLSGSGAQITYRKIFKSSFPEFVEIKINEAGSGTYDIRQLDEDPNPQPFEIGAALAQRIFALAAKLHNFQTGDLDVHRRLANLGEKTFQYEKGSEKYSTKFNYTLDESAGQLMTIFEGLARQTGDVSDLVRTMRYDHLGVNDVLQQIENDYNNKLIPEPERLLPTLDQLAADDKYIDIARQRARNLATRIRTAH